MRLGFASISPRDPPPPGIGWGWASPDRDADSADFEWSPVSFPTHDERGVATLRRDKLGTRRSMHHPRINVAAKHKTVGIGKSCSGETPPPSGTGWGWTSPDRDAGSVCFE
jgi:hypothetical protein